ncbi:LysR family transcriptional regulator [Tepidibacter aestuarii]|uniref:LysR family transcriptional regulator n=1 Tax=Tepidibacter aestuarii TaxID=2925782 RepID=UPI0020C114AC|nr:LysR family transcriptional regulator [Tepidibacter aestuarii]CAH2212679.1 LysR family transcriptional regulator, transcriptional activator of the cysJI operon [Tepidibacter aestuarii]
MIDTRLDTFITVVKTKNYTKAAQILNLTQPAVSQQIKYLENYYNAELIKKANKTIYLTKEGDILYNYAQKIKALNRALKLEIKNNSSSKKIHNVGATMTTGEYVMPYILGDYKNDYPNIDIILSVDNTKVIIEKLMGGEIEIALIEGYFDKNKFKYIKLKDDELVLAVSPKHEFAHKREVELEEVIKGNLILREKGSGTRDIFERKISDVGYDIENVNVYMEIRSINAIKSLVESNLGYTIISKEAIKREVNLELIKIVPIKNIKIEREFNFIYKSSSFLDFINSFIKYCYNHK